MKLIQLNTWEGRMDRPLYKFLEEQKPDILMLQEVLSSPDGKSHYFDFLQKAQKKSGLPHVFFSPVLDHVFGGGRTFYGNAILANAPFTAKHKEFTHLKYKEDWDAAKDSDDMKLFQHAVISVAGKPLNLINYHGHKAETKAGDHLTEKHCWQIARYITGLRGPTILAGDFNLRPDALSLIPLNKMLTNLCLENKVTTTRNQNASNQEPVDHIWVSNEIDVIHFDVLPDLVSDHAALRLEFEI